MPLSPRSRLFGGGRSGENFLGLLPKQFLKIVRAANNSRQDLISMKIKMKIPLWFYWKNVSNIWIIWEILDYLPRCRVSPKRRAEINTKPWAKWTQIEKLANISSIEYFPLNHRFSANWSNRPRQRVWSN